VYIDAARAASWPPAYRPTSDRHAGFINSPALVGMQAASPDKQVSLFWEADRPIQGSLTTFVHLIDRDGRRVAQVDKLPGNGSYPTSVWTTGERVIDRAYPAMLDRCAGGETVRVEVGWYELREGNPQRRRADSAGTSALAGEMTLPYFTYPLDSWQPAVHNPIPISPTLTLEGYTLHDQDLYAGSPLTLDLLWHNTDPHNQTDAGLAEFQLSLLNGTEIHELWQGKIAPGSDWENGEALCRRIHLSLPQELAVGDYTLAVAGAMLAGAEAIPLGAVTIAPSTRLYELPDLARTIQVTFTGEADGEIVLVGLSEEPAIDAENSQLAVDLVWQPMARINGNYKAFVHLLDSSGTIIAQSDAVPGGAGVTSRWLPGEFILDRHILTLSPEVVSSDDLAGYQLVAGLYDSIDMQRLQARMANGDDLPDGRASLGALSLPSP
jgi:hypothetical protein